MPQKKISTGKTSDTGKLRSLAKAKLIENKRKPGLSWNWNPRLVGDTLQYRPKLVIG